MKITVYTTNTCAYCHMVKRLLDAKKKAYEIVNLDDHPEQRAGIIELSGAMTTPITVIENNGKKEVVIGYNPVRLIPAIN